jgi:hypothetical protein
MHSEPKNSFSWRVDLTHFLDLYARERIKWVRIRLTVLLQLEVFSFLGKKFSHSTVDGQNGVPNSPTKKGYAHSPWARGCVKNLVHNRVHNLVRIVAVGCQEDRAVSPQSLPDGVRVGRRLKGPFARSPL